MGIALIEVPFETPDLVPVFLHQGKSHFGDESWNAGECGAELLILARGINDSERADALKNKREEVKSLRNINTK